MEVCGVARVFQDFLNQNHIRVLPWPALSPDLSPIEHLLDELGRHVRHRQIPPETLQELDVIKDSLLQKGQTERIKNTVSVFYRIQFSLNYFELNAIID
jgi:transposase